MTFREITDDKKFWFQIPERDAVAIKADKKLVGTFWKVNQWIVRVGYLNQPLDFDDLEVDKEARLLLEEEVTKSMCLWDRSESEVLKRRAKEIVDDMLHRYRNFPRYQARASLMHKANKGKVLERAMWYIKSEEPRYVMLTGTKRCMTGKYYAPSGGYDYWGEYDYEPGGIDGPQHTIFEGLLFVNWGLPNRFTREHFETWGEHCYIHPLDLTEQVKEA